jgi:hypothetical protein
MSIVVLFFVVETSPLNWILHGVWSCIALFFGWMGPFAGIAAG